MVILITLALNIAHAFSPAYEELLKSHVQISGRVKYEDLSLETVDSMLVDLSKSEIDDDRNEQMAFWINAYNALTLALIAKEYPIESIRDLDDGKVWSKRSYVVANRKVTLDDIEHKILRPMKDPRIHAALNCASLGCPSLWTKPYTAKNLDKQLDDSMIRWMKTNAYKIDAETIQISKVFVWFENDFIAPDAVHYPKYPKQQWGVLYFIERYANDEELSTAVVRGHALKPMPYDWSLNKVQD